MGFFSRAFLVFLMKESKKRRPKQLGKSMAKSRSQPVNLPGAWPLIIIIIIIIAFDEGERFLIWWASESS